jgi:2-iminobutanoate/2-iminopropanoate deaminase
MKKIISTKDAPAPIGPYSQAVFVDDTLYISGQIAINPENGQLVQDNIIEETRRVMKNLDAVLKAAGLDFTHVVKTTIFLSNMNLFSNVNDIYGSYFKDNFPARETVQAAGLPKGVNVEISMIAVKD